MSSTTRPPAVSTTVLLVCITALVCFLAAVCVVLFIAAPEGANPGSLAALLLALVPTTIGSLVSVAKLTQLTSDVQDVSADTAKMTNGFGDAKTRLAVAQVVHPDFLDPTMRDQLAADRQRVESGK